MNKQQLAARIWRCANNMRGKISAEKYKDYILGFIFYKYVSEKEEKFLYDDGWDNEDIEELSEENSKDAEHIKSCIGYFIPYKSLYSTWVASDVDFNVGDVRDALQAFNRNIHKDYHAVYGDIFTSLATGLGDLGDNPEHQLVAIKKLLNIIRPIPMDSKDYDVLGFIYENLIGSFAANAGKKAGEFYTPREVAILMSDIIAYNLQGKKHISIYDPTSGSASLLLTVGESVARHNGDPDSVKYYAQELIKETYNLTRMNLVMRGIKPANIVTKNADTLLDDWPLEKNEIDPLRVDACCSNPPYSTKWVVPTASDPRFDEYGKAPKSKADYAFLLHNLYHLKADGIMTIVLPHGVLFRGGEEGEIRTKLLENGNIEAIIGLPANIFYGTGIPTIVMVLRQARTERDVLFIDASKCFVKDGKKNRLRERDIRSVFDAYKNRIDIPCFAHIATWEEVERNDFNLNIPRYVDSSEKTTALDIYASMFGGIPVAEIDDLDEYWCALPSLRSELFLEEGPYASVGVENIGETVDSNRDVAAFKADTTNTVKTFCDRLHTALFDDDMETLDIRSTQQIIESQLFSVFSSVPLLDDYAVYQEFFDDWTVVSDDLETIQQDGFTKATQAVDPNMVVSKGNNKDDEDEEAQDKKVPWIGRVLPFGIVQGMYLCEESETVTKIEATIAEQEQVCADFVEGLSEEEKEQSFIKDDDSIDVSMIVRFYWEACSEYCSELDGLTCYWDNLKKGEKNADGLLAITARYQETNWSALKAKKDGTYTSKVIEARIISLIGLVNLDEDSLAARLERVIRAIEIEKQAKKELKVAQRELMDATCAYIKDISADEAKVVLDAKWVHGLEVELDGLVNMSIEALKTRIEQLNCRYEITLKDVTSDIDMASATLAEMLGQLKGNDFDMAGIVELKTLLGDEL